jgi:hypothetical protein
MPFPARGLGLPAAEVRQANNGADQQDKNDELEVFKQQGSHRSRPFVVLAGAYPATVCAMCGVPRRNSIGKSMLENKRVIKAEICDTRHDRHFDLYFFLIRRNDFPHRFFIGWNLFGSSLQTN